MTYFTPTGPPKARPRRSLLLADAAPPGPSAPAAPPVPSPPPPPPVSSPPPPGSKPNLVRRAGDWLKRQARKLGEWLVGRALEGLVGGKKN